MPTNVKGVGTIYYGQAEIRPDASFVTTEWIILFSIPLIPLRSFRVRRNRKADVEALVVHSTGYVVLEQLPLQWAQIFKTWLFVLVCGLWWAVLVWSLFSVKMDWDNHYVVLAFCYIGLAALPFLALHFMRREAYRAQHGNSEPPAIPM